MLTGENADEPLIALAFTKLGDGVYPWNMNADKVDDYGFVETIELSGDTFAVVSDNEVSEEDDTDYVYTTGPVSVSYFDDALFIGDSRMEGVYEYARLDNATFLTKVSMSIYTLMESPVSNPDYKTVLDGLTDKQYGKIYIMVGINEIGTATTDYFISHYQKVISQIKELQPDAIIIIQAIMHVTPSRDEADPYFNNANINERNEGLKTLANDVDVFYMDMNPVFDDENGNLAEEYSSDNIHLLANKYVEWRKYLLENGIYKIDASLLPDPSDVPEDNEGVSDNDAESISENEAVSDNEVEAESSEESESEVTDEADNSIENEPEITDENESVSEN